MRERDVLSSTMSTAALRPLFSGHHRTHRLLKTRERKVVGARVGDLLGGRRSQLPFNTTTARSCIIFCSRCHQQQKQALKRSRAPPPSPRRRRLSSLSTCSEISSSREALESPSATTSPSCGRRSRRVLSCSAPAGPAPACSSATPARVTDQISRIYPGATARSRLLLCG